MTRYLNLVSLAVLSAALAGCNEDVARAPEIRPVRTVVVAPKPIAEGRVVVGDIRPVHQSDLGFRIIGKVTSRPVNVGDIVRKGDLIAQLDVTDYRNKLRTAEADLMAAEAVLDEAGQTLERQKRLLAKGYTTKANFNSAKKAQLAAEASLKSAKAAYALAVDQLAYTELKAEFDGIIVATSAEPGQVVNAGQMVARLAPNDQVDAVFAVAEAAFQSKAFAEQGEVSVALLSNPNVTSTGIVHEISPIADAATRTYEVKVLLREPPMAMRFGTSVSGHMATVAELAVELPAGAIYDSAGAPAVWLVEPHSSAVTLKPIRIAQFDAGKVIVADGVDKGDIVVTAGVNRLREGQTVKIMEE